MPIVCPACRADNSEGPACRRCKADLSPLFALEADRASALAEARSALAAGDPGRALPAVLRADLLRRDAESARLAAVCALCAGDFPLAWRLYRQAGQR